MPGLSWWPVIPVMRLSSTQGIIRPLLYTISAAPVMPLWKKVESPTTPNTTLPVTPSFSKLLAMPIPAEKPAPMHTTESMQFRGSAQPRV